MVMAPAKTGRDKSKRKAVYKTDQAKRGIISSERPAPRMLLIVVIKLMEPKMEEMPAR